MRTLTKTGIRILSAKYRSILIKCAIINASVFIGAFGVGSAFAIASTPWEELKGIIENTDDNPITLNVDIERSEGEEDIVVSRPVTIDGQNHTINGDGLSVESGGDLTLKNLSMTDTLNEKTVLSVDVGSSATILSDEQEVSFSGVKNDNFYFIENYDGTMNVITQDKGSLTFSNNTGDTGTVIMSMASSTEGEISRPLHIEAKGGDINFTENSAGTMGGGLLVSGAADVIADNGSVVFDQNTALIGGAICIQSNIEDDRLNVVAMNNDIVFKNNTAEGVIPEYLAEMGLVNGGGAMYASNGQVDIIANGGTVKFEKNSTTGFGGAIFGVGGGMSNVPNEINIIAENNDITFSGNKAAIGGAIANIGELNIKAKAGHTVEFVTTDDSIANANAFGVDSVLTINDADKGYTGDVILQDVVAPATLTDFEPSASPGKMIIGGGRVFAEGIIQQNEITVKNATLTLSEKNSCCQ